MSDLKEERHPREHLSGMLGQPSPGAPDAYNCIARFDEHNFGCQPLAGQDGGEGKLSTPWATEHPEKAKKRIPLPQPETNA